MNDAEYNKFLQVLRKEMDYINQAVNQQNNQQNYQGNQQRQNQQNNRYRHN